MFPEELATRRNTRGGRVATARANPAGGSVSLGSKRRRSMPITRRSWGETPGRVRLRALTRSNCQYLDRTRNQIYGLIH